LADAGVDASPERLAEALVRLADSACIQRVQRQLHPELIVSHGMKLFDDVDALAADVANAMKQHHEEFESEGSVVLLAGRSRHRVRRTLADSRASETFGVALLQP
jgi:hypothetical protein